MFKGVNWIAVLAATVANIALAFTWYDVVFASTWHQLDPSAPASTHLDAKLVGGVITTLVLVTGMAWVFARSGVSSLGGALLTALVVCVAFDTTVYAGNVFFSGSRVDEMLFYAVFDLISFLTTGAILALMPPRAARAS